MFEFFKRNKVIPKGHIKQMVANTRTIGVFTALKTFTCPATGSEYVKGMQYNIRQGNLHLEATLSSWTAAGKVRIG